MRFSVKMEGSTGSVAAGHAGHIVSGASQVGRARVCNVAPCGPTSSVRAVAVPTVRPAETGGKAPRRRRRVGGSQTGRQTTAAGKEEESLSRSPLTTTKTRVTLLTAELSSDEMRTLENLVQQPQQPLPSHTPYIKVLVCVSVRLFAWGCGRFVCLFVCLCHLAASSQRLFATSAPGLFATPASAPGLAQGTVDVAHKGESTFFSVLVGERHFSSVAVRSAPTPRGRLRGAAGPSRISGAARLLDRTVGYCIVTSRLRMRSASSVYSPRRWLPPDRAARLLQGKRWASGLTTVRKRAAHAS
jgi:hypothetical protein